MLLVALSIALLASPGTAAARSLGEGPPAIMTVDADRVTWEPQIENGGLVLTISGPCGFDLREEFDPEGPAVFYSEGREDGTYRYELLFLPVGEPGSSPDPTRGLEPDCIDVVTMSGTLTIVNERFVPPEEEEGRGAKAPPPLAAPSDILHYDDVIITGSLCVGFDCQNGESFGFDTIILKEHNLRIYFNDTSYSASYPTNNWRITINSSTNGGGSYFSIDDADEGTSPFRIEAEAPSYSLYVDDYGRVGLGTSSPAAEAHIKDSDTPTVRLEQDGSGGWTPQTWDVAGNESNFFVRDVTNGSKLPFRIIPEAPTNSIYIASDGDVGMGTSSPGYPLEVETTGEGATIVVDRTDGATGKLAAKPDRVQVGTISNHDLHFVRNNSLVGHFDSSGDLWITGVLHESSDVNAKTGIAPVDGDEVLAAVAELPISTWSYRDDPGVRHLGPMAQDFAAAFGLGESDTHIASLDTSGVALAAIQALAAENAELRAGYAEMEARLAALERSTGVQPSFLALLPWLLLAIAILGAGLALGKRLYGKAH